MHVHCSTFNVVNSSPYRLTFISDYFLQMSLDLDCMPDVDGESESLRFGSHDLMNLSHILNFVSNNPPFNFHSSQHRPVTIVITTS